MGQRGEEPGDIYAEKTLESIPMSLRPRKKSGSTRVIQPVGMCQKRIRAENFISDFSTFGGCAFLVCRSRTLS